MNVTIKKVKQLIAEGVLFAPMDGNHGEKHPKTSDYVESGIPFILVPDLVDGTVDIENCNYISKEQAKTLRKGFSKTGDVLFTHKATIGKVALVDTKEYEYIILTPQVTYYRIKDSNVLNNEYLYYYFQSHSFQETFRLYSSSGGTRDYLGIVAQQRLPIIYPDLNTQKNIVTILSAYDKLIRNNNKRIKLLEQMAENLYKEWFVRFRFPGHEKAEFENGIPKGWEVLRIKELSSLKSGYAFKSEWFTDEGYCVAKIKDIGSVIMDTNDLSFVEEKNCTKARKFILNEGDLTIALTGATIGKISIVPKFDVPIYTNQRLGKFFNGNNPIDRLPFLYCFFSQKEITQTILNISNASSAQPNISPEQIENIKFIGNIRLIDKFNEQTKLLFKQILVLHYKNDSLIKQRDLLLPRLMSGKLEV